MFVSIYDRNNWETVVIFMASKKEDMNQYTGHKA